MPKKFGWKADLPDHRDERVPTFLKMVSLPPSVDLRPKCPPIYDQKNLGSCTANAVGALFQFTEMEQRGAATDIPSRLFVYWNTRSIEGTTAYDAGATIRNTIKAVYRLGDCREVDWPYIEDRFKKKPIKACYDQAILKKAQGYARVPQTEYDIKFQIYSNNPVAFGFSVFESLMTLEVSKTGNVKMPLRGEKMLGGHAVLIVGYDDGDRTFLVRNSWGAKWGIKGYFKMPYEYVLSPEYSDDLWTLTKVS